MNCIFDHYNQTIDDSVFSILNSLSSGKGYYLPSKKECFKLIAILQDFVDNYNEENINSINNDINICLNGDLPHYITYPPTNISKKTKNKTSGFIYFVQDDLLRTKIGKTIEINKRITTLSVKMPNPLILFHSIPTNDIHSSEKFFHDRYQEFRMQGEWFDLPPNVLDQIKTF